MYNRVEIMDAIECANANIKIAKEQIKRIEKMRNLQNEILLDNCFGAVAPWIEQYCDFIDAMEEQIKKSTENLKRYKKMLKLIDEMEKLNGEA